MVPHSSIRCSVISTKNKSPTSACNFAFPHLCVITCGYHCNGVNTKTYSPTAHGTTNERKWAEMQMNLGKKQNVNVFPAHYITLRNYLSSFSVAYGKKKVTQTWRYREQWAANESRGEGGHESISPSPGWAARKGRRREEQQICKVML